MINISTIHGQINETMTPLKGLIKSYKRRPNDHEDYPVDFVVTWVDGSDPNWRKERNNYLTTKDINKGNGEERYRDWGLFRYWFRMVEKYAPWVNKIYLVTWGHVPAWINSHHEKLRIVTHEEFIPSQYLPTFSSIPIELNLWRIPGLSEHFVYFNDDVYLGRPTSKTDFFEAGLPKYCAVAKPYLLYSNSDLHAHQLVGDIGLINGHFNIRKSIVDHPEKWFSHVYGKNMRYNLRIYKDGYIAGMKFTHLGCPFRKATYEKVWDILFPKLDSSSYNRFRQATDVMHQIFQLWDICEGEFIPVAPDYYGREPLNMITSIDEICSIFAKQSDMMICLNDDQAIDEECFATLSEKITRFFNSLFGEKSSFEK